MCSEENQIQSGHKEACNLVCASYVKLVPMSYFYHTLVSTNFRFLF